MRIVLISCIPETLSFYRGLIDTLVEQKHEVRIICSKRPALDRLEHMGCQPCPIELSRRISPLKDLIALFQIVRCLRRWRPDLVHAHTPKGGLLGMLGAWLARVPIRIYTVHGLPLETATGWKRRLLWWSERLACRLAGEVLVVSNSLRQRLVEERIMSADKPQLLGDGSACGIDADTFRPRPELIDKADRLRAQWKIARHVVVFGFVGRLVPDKGIGTLTQAFFRLYEQDPNVRLLLVGELDRSRECLKPYLLEQIRTHPAVIQTGYVEDPAPYYAAMDVLVLPSRREGLNIAILEAAAMERPAITTRATGCVDAVVEGETGLLIDVDDVDQLVAAMEELAGDSDRRDRMGQAARRRVCDRFSMERLVAEHLRLYERVLGPARR